MPIQVLPPQIVNQIAAGEVVGRPASVVKELVENSLDAGASHIEVHIEHGGAKRIHIRDNGCGIPKEELILALTPHATSKITSFTDLENITSMGFRGEALASVSAVSRLTLTSCTETKKEGWQAYSEGRELTVALKPAPHPTGTTVEVLDLFYNTPVRRRFMRMEKTEFTHIDEVIRRLAIARLDVTFVLKHNGKIVHHYRGVSQKNQYLRRLGGICGSAFVEHALGVSWQHSDLAISGWIVDPRNARVPEIQYSYVNGRIIHDKVIHHAIRQAYQEKLIKAYQPIFVLFLHVNPHHMDINVHPTKHEVRFYQARLVHDFTYQAVLAVLSKIGVSCLSRSERRTELFSLKPHPASGCNTFSLPVRKTSFPILKYSGTSTSTVETPSILSSSLKSWEIRETGKNTAFNRWSQRDRRDGTALSHISPEIEHRSNTDHLHKESLLYRELIKSTLKIAGGQRAQMNIISPTESANPVPITNDSPGARNRDGFWRVLTLITPYYALIESTESFALLSLVEAEHQLMLTNDRLKSQSSLYDRESIVIKRNQTLFQAMEIAFQTNLLQVILKVLPLSLHEQNLQNSFSNLLDYLQSQKSITYQEMIPWFSACLMQKKTVAWSYSSTVQLLADLEQFCPEKIKFPPSKLLVKLNFDSLLNNLDHD
ncbi:DNA mismatch repair endonuclease MutL [Candidatus Steffania adelgidicola]|uniref:DNA mismatch repair endonuclease MutL n=1 Tax=Candidatus Steffania adelgidicola TaxID=1076626 RepID=UPI001D0347DE|nr:DNA mismatch repair endonuclease MutL [Candidatus Steffania adelgidicola]UDG79509.1 DNA mismatch repair protein MutL [Candidatus Steffania adelgidicola]